MNTLLPRQQNAVLRTCRQFSSTSPFHASRAIQAANKQAKRAKAKLKDSNSEAMTIHDAATILRAMEVGSPSAAYEITITTKFVRGQAIPRGRVSLPKDARAKAETVLVFASPKVAPAARAAGAHYVGGEELIPDVSTAGHDRIHFSIMAFSSLKILASNIIPTKVICTPALLPIVTQKLARFLGPKGLMPAEKRGTVTNNVIAAVQQAQGTMNWRSDKLGVIRAPVARVSWPIDDVVGNIKAFVQTVKKGTGPEDADASLGRKKASSILQIFLSSRQGPGIRLTDAL
ncbi:mitochondrial 54S ribosomal protein mrpl1 [Tulasnella sp. 403]|nr:mitochondrial 54S ribosomal protein mrpl1 [Tulasnella sp. 403]